MSGRITFNPTEDLNLGEAFSDDAPDSRAPSVPRVAEALQEDAETRPGPSAPNQTRPRRRKQAARVAEVVVASTRLHLQLTERIADALRDHARDTHASQPDVLNTALVRHISHVRDYFAEYVAEDKERQKEGLPPKKRAINREAGRRKVSMRVPSSVADRLSSEAATLVISRSELAMRLLELELELAVEGAVGL